MLLFLYLPFHLSLIESGTSTYQCTSKSCRVHLFVLPPSREPLFIVLSIPCRRLKPRPLAPAHFASMQVWSQSKVLQGAASDLRMASASSRVLDLIHNFKIGFAVTCAALWQSRIATGGMICISIGLEGEVSEAGDAQRYQTGFS